MNMYYTMSVRWQEREKEREEKRGVGTLQFLRTCGECGRQKGVDDFRKVHWHNNPIRTRRCNDCIEQKVVADEQKAIADDEKAEQDLFDLRVSDSKTHTFIDVCKLSNSVNTRFVTHTVSSLGGSELNWLEKQRRKFLQELLTTDLKVPENTDDQNQYKSIILFLKQSFGGCREERECRSGCNGQRKVMSPHFFLEKLESKTSL